MIAWIAPGLRWRAGALLLLLLCCLVARPVAAEDADSPAYREVIDEAVAEFSASHFEEARALFKRAHELSPNARTLRGMGMAAFELRMYVQAMRELDASLHDLRKPLDPDMRVNVEALIDKARAFVGRVRVTLEPTEAKLLVDGQAPEPEADGSLLLDAATHTFGATANGYKPTSMRIAIEGGSEQNLRLPLEPLPALAAGVPAIDQSHPLSPEAPAPPPAAPKPSRPTEPPANYETFAFITLVGAAGFGTAAGVFWFVGGSQYDDVKKQCAPTCTDAQIDDSGVATSDLLANVFLGAAIASGVASGVLFALDLGQSGERSDAPVVALGPTPVQLRGHF